MKFWEIDNTQHRAITNTFITFLCSYFIAMLLEGAIYFGDWTPQGRIICLLFWIMFYYYLEVRPYETQ